MRKKRAAALFLCGLLLAVFALRPDILYKGTDLSFMRQWIKGDTLEFEGYLTVWHVPSKASGTGSGDSYLHIAVDGFQKANFGVFFELETMDAQELQSRLDAGLRPDLISFNGGDIADPTGLFAPLEPVDALLPGLAEAGYYEGENYACPYMAGANAIIVMDDDFYSLGLTPPAGPEYIDAAWLEETAAEMGAVDGAANLLAVDENNQLAAMALLLGGADMEQEGVNALAAAPAAGARSLADKDGPGIMLGGLDTIYQLESAGKDVSYSVYPLEKYITRLQFMGICDSGDTDRMEAATGFVNYLLGTKRQARLEGVWALPVVDTGDTMPENAHVAPFWHTVGADSIYLLGAFDAGVEAEFYEMRARAMLDKNVINDIINWLQLIHVADES